MRPGPADTIIGPDALLESRSAMAVASNSTARSAEYRFGEFRLNPAAHELWVGPTLRPTSPLVFECLVYLLEHRQRMIGRDELISAVWGSVDVADQQVRQLVQRARATVDDDAKRQDVIRTVAGSGYRWVMAVETIEPPAAPGPSAEVRTAAAAAVAPSSPLADQAAAAAVREAGEPAGPARRPASARRAILALLAAGLVLTAVVAWLHGRHDAEPVVAPAPADAPRAVVVLPLAVSGPPEAGWVRLGAMDLIAQRLRSAGMPVPPSDSVVAAVHAVGAADAPGWLPKLRDTLGAAMLVQGSAAASSGAWKVELSVTDIQGRRHLASAERAEVVEAVRDATDLLLAALGESVSADADERRDDLDRLLQRARAALLGNQLDAARSILAGAPDALKGEPRVRVVAAQIDQRGGRLDDAERTLQALIDDPAAAGDPDSRADALATLGYIELSRNDCEQAHRRFDGALAALRDPRGSRYGRILTARGSVSACLGRIEAALSDLSAAGPAVDAAGDRLGRANLDNHFGGLELYRGRPAQAVAYLQSAQAVHQSFGAVGSLVQDLSLLCVAYGELLQWPQARQAAEALWALREQVGDAGVLYAMAGLRARTLVRSGELDAAQSLLDGIEAARPEGSRVPSALTFHEARAELAWQRGDPRSTIEAIDAARALVPEDRLRDDEDLYVVRLLRQRAEFALGQAPPQAAERASDQGADGSVPVLVARAEWLASAGTPAAAEAAFRTAMTAAEARDVPAMTVLAVTAFSRWLLAEGRSADALSTAGRIAPWAERDFDSAVLQAEVFQSAGQPAAWAAAWQRAQKLAGERRLPAGPATSGSDAAAGD